MTSPLVRMPDGQNFDQGAILKTTMPGRVISYTTMDLTRFPPGEKQPLYMKYGIGGLLVLLLIFIIWFPLLFMSVVTTNSIPNEPTAFECSLSISGLQVVYILLFLQTFLTTVYNFKSIISCTVFPQIPPSVVGGTVFKKVISFNTNPLCSL